MNTSRALLAVGTLLSIVACGNDRLFTEKTALGELALDGDAGSPPPPPTPPTPIVTNAGGNLRTGWYPDQTGLDPSVIASATFGRRFDTLLSTAGRDQVFAQPLVVGDRVFIATESNNLYLISSSDGSIARSSPLMKNGQAQAPWDATAICGDLKPTIGVSGTPVIDLASNTAYLFSKTYEPDGSAAWYVHAVDVDTLAEREDKGFPVKIEGVAANHPEVRFDAFAEMQRPGLLLLNGVVYAGFGSHCDYSDNLHKYVGWIVGVGTDGQIKTLFSTSAGGGGRHGAGVWHAGGGLVSDGPGRIFFETGNAYPSWDPNTPPTPGNTPPDSLGEAMVRADVQADGSLRAADFFTPSNANELDRDDRDLGSGGPIALPEEYFGASPKLAVGVGKEGIVYLFDRDNLGGYRQGAGGVDGTLNRVNADAGAWSRPSIWPGDGGYIYLTPNSKPLNVFRFGLDAANKPSLSRAGQSAESFGYTSGSPIVTSNGTQSGSALVWVTSTTGSYGAGQLRAYDAVPDANGVLPLRFSDAIGTQAKFSVPGVGTGRIFVGTADGHVIGYGAPLTSPVAGARVDFGAVAPHTAKTLSVTITANQALTINALVPTGAAGVFTLGDVALPVSLASGESLSVAVTFVPNEIGSVGESLDIQTSAGLGAIGLKGAGRSDGGQLTVSPLSIAFGGLLVNTSKSANVVFTNSGSQPLTFTSVAAASAPFFFTGLPSAGQTLAQGESVVAVATFAPASKGDFTAALPIATTAGNANVALSGSCGDPGQMAISTDLLQFGDVPVGQRRAMVFNVSNRGGLDLTITKSKPPAAGGFTALSTIPEGMIVKPGQTLTQSVTFQPTAAGAATSGWIITADDGAGVQTVDIVGNGVIGQPGIDYASGFNDASALELNGATKLNGAAVVLTDGPGQTASFFAHTTVPVTRFQTEFTVTQLNAAGDGLTFTIQNGAPQALGGGGGGLGYFGLAKSVAIKLDLYDNAGEGNNSTGLYSAGVLPTQPSVPLDNGVDLHAGHPLHVTMTYDGGTLTSAIQDTVTGAVSTHAYAVNIPLLVGDANAYVGFTAGTGGASAIQSIRSWTFTPIAPPNVDFSAGFSDVSSLQLNGASAVAAGDLRLTNAAGQRASVFTRSALPIQRFSTTFAVQLTNANADGLTFTLQNVGPQALGGGGGALGYAGIASSVAIKLDLYNNQGEGKNSTGLYSGGATPTLPAIAIDNGVNLHGGHLLQVSLTYDGATLDVSIQDTVTQAISHHAYAVNIPQLVGGANAYIGFTGGTGGLFATQSIKSWSFTSN